MVRRFLAVGLLACLLATNAYAAKKPAKTVPTPAPVVDTTPVESPKLQKCLKRADDLPDIAAVEAAAWIKQGGGNEAHLCRAFAQANRGMHADSAREFWYLASYFAKRDAQRSISMEDLSAQEFTRDKDYKNAEARYTAALKLAPADADNLTGRAVARMSMEKYWDALDDLNRALKVLPDNVDALRKRGKVWLQLGNSKNAQEDFEHAAALAPPDDTAAQ